MSTTYAKSRNGLLHVIHPIGGEHTLCGDAFDIDSEKGDEEHAWVDARPGLVTCEKCAAVIRACRGVKIQKPTQRHDH